MLFTVLTTEETTPDSESISSTQSNSTSHSSSRKLSKPSNQFKITSIHQITDQERVKIAKTIILEYAGSSKAYRLALIALRAVNIASEEVYRKIDVYTSSSSLMNTQSTETKKILQLAGKLICSCKNSF